MEQILFTVLTAMGLFLISIAVLILTAVSLSATGVKTAWSKVSPSKQQAAM